MVYPTSDCKAFIQQMTYNWDYPPSIFLPLLMYEGLLYYIFLLFIRVLGIFDKSENNEEENNWQP